MAKHNADIFNYENMYLDLKQQAWREIGAKDKSKNIARILFRNLNVDQFSICEVGCGDGAIAKELNRAALFSKYLGIDISSSGIEVATKRGISGATFKRFSQIDGRHAGTC